MGRRADPHQRRIVGRRSAAIATVYRERVEMPGNIFASGEHDQAERKDNGRRRVEAFHPVRTDPLVRQTGGPPRTAAAL